MVQRLQAWRDGLQWHLTFRFTTIWLLGFLCSLHLQLYTTHISAVSASTSHAAAQAPLYRLVLH